jgi:glutathione synthase/RimK-type ligase-like ATP-grasp enzyme
MILILAETFEPNVARVVNVLDHYRARWSRLNGEDFPLKASVELNWSQLPPTGTLHDSRGQKVSLSAVRAVWNRRRGKNELTPGLTDGQQQFIRNECEHTLSGLYALLAHAVWMNDYFSQWRANNKLFQLMAAQACGLRTPETVITQDPEIARKFCARRVGGVLCKPISLTGIIPADESHGVRAIYSNVIAPEASDDFDRVRSSPTLFQEYVEKDYELRITIVGSLIFPAAIDSQSSEQAKVDWRHYDHGNAPVSPCKLPEGLQQMLLLLMRRLGLEFGAIDMIRDKQGHYVFLEVNPAGQWGWIEAFTGLPIHESVARWLMTRSCQS